MLLEGWSLSPADPAARPAVRVVQQGADVAMLHPAFPAPQLRTALGLPPAPGPANYLWRLWLPLANGLKPDVPFSVLFAETGAPLGRGSDLVIPLLGAADAGALRQLQDGILLTHTLDAIDGTLGGAVRVLLPVSGAEPELRVGERCRALQPAELLGQPGLFGKKLAVVKLSLAKEEVLGHPEACFPIGLENAQADESTRFADAVRTVRIPKSLFDRSLLKAPLPDRSNMVRVAGPQANDSNYLIGGATTFFQMDQIASRHFGKRLTDFDRIVDWGAGCARVARHFFETAPGLGMRPPQPEQVLGLDIDETNLAWCRANMDGLGRYELLGLDGFDIADASVDLLYGISVMTHLSEQHQRLWLDDIRRILKPGGCALLTVHGENDVYRSPHFPPLPFVQKFGFFDGLPDAAIGADRDTYYRAAYHSRAYLERNWKRGFEMIEVIPAANAFSQDFVVLRRC
jgi:SAM-dependent methyltransferase